MKKYIFLFAILLGSAWAMAQTFNQLTTAAITAPSGIKWYSASTGGTLYDGAATIPAAATYYASQTVNGAESTLRFPVAVTINPLPTITLTTGVITSVTFNAVDQLTDLDYTGTTNTPTSYSINWDAVANLAGLLDQGNTTTTFNTTADTISTILVTGGTVAGVYSGVLTIVNANGCSTSHTVTITVTGG